MLLVMMVFLILIPPISLENRILFPCDRFSTLGLGAFRFPDLNSSPDLRRTKGHVTDSTGLPRHLFPDDGRHTYQVFGSASGVSMGEDEQCNQERSVGSDAFAAGASKFRSCLSIGAGYRTPAERGNISMSWSRRFRMYQLGDKLLLQGGILSQH